MTAPILEIKNISKHFGKTEILSDINLVVNKQEFLTILGPSGCGKTTLLRLIGGFDSPSSGSVFLHGKDITNLPPNQRHINTVFQSYALFPHMNVLDNIGFGLRCQKMPESEVKNRVFEALSLVKLYRHAYKKPEELSGGQQQRVAIARALVNKPDLLLLDEPLSSLDYRLRKNMQIELKHLQQKLNMTFIMVTHDQEEALSTANTIVVMNEGVIEQIGTPREIYETPANKHVADFVGEANTFESVITNITNNRLEAEIEGKIKSFKNTHDFKLNDAVTIILRPEDLMIYRWDEAKDDHTLYPCIVSDIIYKGSTVDLILTMESGKKINATQFFNEDDENLVFKEGERVMAGWHEDWEVVLAS